MKSVLLLSCVLLSQVDQSVLHQLEQQNCGVFYKKDLSLYNNEVNIGSRPWMALIKIKIDDKPEQFACVGTLINDHFVLTAAPCVYNHLVISVRLGEHDQSTDPDCRTYDNKKKCLPSVEDINVKQVVIHEEYDDPVSTNDIALLELVQKVEFKEHISPICLPPYAELPQKVETLQSMLLTGWGFEDEYIKKADILREIDLARDRNCALVVKDSRFKLEPTQLCSYLNDILCRATSGSPMSSPVQYLGKERFVQFGIITHGVRGCTTSTPGVSTNVASFLPWIIRVLGQQAVTKA